MKRRDERFAEIADTDMLEKVIRSFENKNKILDDEYYLLITDYLISLGECNLNIDIDKIVTELPNKIKNIRKVSNSEIGGVYGKTTPDNTILINGDLDKEKSKLYFFHELTHAVQRNNHGTGLYNSKNKNGDFFNEGLTQSIAEMVYQVSSDTTKEFEFQNGKIPGQQNRMVYSSLELYQMNESYLQLFCLSTGISFLRMMELSFNENNREILENYFKVANDNQEDINSILDELEEIYSVNYLLWTNPNAYQLLSQNGLCEVENNDKIYHTNLQRVSQLMDNYEEKMIQMFFKNNNEQFVQSHANAFYNMLTTNKLKNIFKEYQLNWLNDMKNQREIMASVFSNSNTDDELFQNAEKVRKIITNNALKRELDEAIGQIKNEYENNAGKSK